MAEAAALTIRVAKRLCLAIQGPHDVDLPRVVPVVETIARRETPVKVPPNIEIKSLLLWTAVFCVFISALWPFVPLLSPIVERLILTCAVAFYIAGELWPYC
jgi:hypothetical protein